MSASAVPSPSRRFAMVAQLACPSVSVPSSGLSVSCSAAAVARSAASACRLDARSLTRRACDGREKAPVVESISTSQNHLRPPAARTGELLSTMLATVSTSTAAPLPSRTIAARNKSAWAASAKSSAVSRLASTSRRAATGSRQLSVAMAPRIAASASGFVSWLTGVSASSVCTGR